MANPQNLIPQAHRLTVEEQSMGGKASAEARRKRKTFAEAFELFLTSDHKDKNGVTMSGIDILSEAVLKKAVKGDLRAFELIRDTVGEKPIDKVAKVEISQDIRDKVEALVEEYGQKSGN